VQQAVSLKAPPAKISAGIVILLRFTPLYDTLKDGAGWAAYLEDLRTQFKHLPALQDELRKAKL
jgi:hypothetical protein